MIKTKSWAHTGLAVRDLSVASDFYQAAFGYEVAFREHGIGREIADITGIAGQICDLVQLRSPYSGHVLELLQFHGFETAEPARPGAPLRPGEAHVAFLVEDLEDALRHVRSLGATMIGIIAEFPEGRAVYCREPGGSFFEMEEAAGGDGR
jgi:catechol 2,3-dioxygenase-like lactoylglutathione lyase family enzyme